MYKAQRISESVESTDLEVPVAFAAPRRAARTRVEILRSRVAPAVLSVAVLAAGTAYAMSPKEEATAAVPAPVREDVASRDTSRELAQTPAQEQPAAEAALMGASWTAAIGQPAGVRYAQGDVVVRAAANESAAQVATVAKGAKVDITDKAENGFRQVVAEGKLGWVAESQLGASAPVEKPAPKPEPTKEAKPAAKAEPKPEAKKAEPKPEAKPEPKPAAKPAAEKVAKPAAYTGGTVLGLKPKAMVVYNAVTARWSFSSIGGYRPYSRSNHQRGGAIDFMLKPGAESAKGWAVANFLAANMDTFDLDHIIFEQKIYTRYNRFWRPMENRGSITANHYDHVHVSVAGI